MVIKGFEHADFIKNFTGTYGDVNLIVSEDECGVDAGQKGDEALVLGLPLAVIPFTFWTPISKGIHPKKT